MARVLSTAFCVLLLAATAGAFALTEGAKTELSPIYGTRIDKLFSPTCNPHVCLRQSAEIVFKLRKKEHIEVWMERHGERVSTVVAGKTYPRGKVSLEFDGIADDGLSTLPDGFYRPVIRLTNEHRTITLPNRIELDTKAPQAVKFKHRVYTHISPDGDHHDDSFSESYTLNGPGRGVLLVDGHQAELIRKLSVHGVLEWKGQVDGKLKPPGNYVLEIAAQDAAGNRSQPFPFAVVTIRYLKLARTKITVGAGRRFYLRVLTDAPKLTWLLDRGRGSSSSHTLRLRAPRKPGDYRLYVTASGHTAGADVVVQ